MKDESTTSNNIDILNDIYNIQLGLDKGNMFFEQGLRLVFGDLKTWKRIQAVKSLRHDISKEPFERFDWLLAGIGLWHLIYNFAQLIHRIHFGGGLQTDPSTLQHAADAWGRHQVAQPNNYKALEDLIIHSYRSRIVGLWIRLLRRNSGMDIRRVEDALTWLKSQDRSSWESVLEQISRQIQPHFPKTEEDL